MMRDWLDRKWLTLAAVGSVGYVVAIAVTVVDVVGRLFGVVLIRGAIDIVVVCMVLAGAFAVAMAEWRDANVRVDPLTMWIPKGMRGGIDRLWRLVTAVLLGLICWISVGEAVTAYSYGEVLPSIGLSVAVLGILICIGFGVGALAAVVAMVWPPVPSDDE